MINLTFIPVRKIAANASANAAPLFALPKFTNGQKSVRNFV